MKTTTHAYIGVETEKPRRLLTHSMIIGSAQACIPLEGRAYKTRPGIIIQEEKRVPESYSKKIKPSNLKPCRSPNNLHPSISSLL